MEKTKNEELYDLYSSPNVIRVIKSRRIKWAGHVARLGRRRIYIGFVCVCVRACGKLKQKDHLEDLNVDGRAVLNLTLKKSDWRLYIVGKII